MHRCCFCGQMDFDILLGHVFFTDSRCLINYDTRCIEMEGSTPTPFIRTPTSVEKTCTIKIPQRVLIKSNSVMYITGSLAVERPAVGVIRPSALKASEGVLIAASIADVSRGEIMVKVSVSRYLIKSRDYIPFV